MATPHVCNVDCKPVLIRDAEGEVIGRGHEMYASRPSSAAGRYQWEQNRALLDAGRRAWRASGQGQTRACREWDERRRVNPDDWPVRYGVMGRRITRELRDIWAIAI